jgi:MoxR-vWA-beta-propeller ternary system domain bpX5
LKTWSIPVNWNDRTVPLAPVGLVAFRTAALELAGKLVAMDDQSVTQWSAVSTSNVLVLLGDGQTLPWVDGVRYLGRDPSAPHLLLPTNREPDVPVDLLERALIQRSPVLSPFAVIPELGEVISLSSARELSRQLLVSWLRGAA